MNVRCWIEITANADYHDGSACPRFACCPVRPSEPFLASAAGRSAADAAAMAAQPGLIRFIKGRWCRFPSDGHAEVVGQARSETFRIVTVAIPWGHSGSPPVAEAAVGAAEQTRCSPSAAVCGEQGGIALEDEELIKTLQQGR